MKKVIVPFLLCLLLLVGCGGKTSGYDPDAAEGTPVYTAAYPKADYTVSDGFSFSIAGNETVKAVHDRIVLKFSADAENRYGVALKVEDSSFRLLGQTGLLRPGTFLEAMDLDFVLSENDDITLTVTAYDQNGRPVRAKTVYRVLDVSENG